MELYNEKRVTLNVGGERHEVMWKTLEKLPNSRLGRIRFAKQIDELKELCDDINIKNNEIFFDRHSNSFGSVLNYYRTGKLHLVDDICVLSFHEDLFYWGIDECVLETCCHLKYHQKKEDLMENPHTSLAARLIAFISIFFVILSTVTLTLNTIPELQLKVGSSNRTNVSDIHMIHEDNPIFEKIEAVCIAWFTFEFLLRSFTAPNLFRFLKSPLNIVDIMSILPFYLSFLVPKQNLSLNTARRILTLFKVLRVLRIFKLARHSLGLKTLGYVLKNSHEELGLLMLIFVIAVLLFSSLAYFAEKEEYDTKFTSIPISFW